MVFVHPLEPKSHWETAGGIVWFYKDGHMLRQSHVTHKDLHDPKMGFKFKELKNE
ncbi:hypothetical protein [Klebsiella phage vB_KpnP_IME1309]|uniref:Uncharacterized protein n=1 Tax=Klebsiella phage 150004 TaxID=2979595 RepID=A0A977PKW6_9CAUD|nr:hypothetical protein OJNDCHOG_00220 [Klebsiella phage 150004]WOZ56695.1 hypothetical protein GHCGIGKI_01230 [Klebsiella phage P06]